MAQPYEVEAPAKCTDVQPAPKMSKLAIATEEVQLPENQKKVVLLLKEYQESHLSLEEEYRREWNELKLKYLEKFQPLYNMRRKALIDNDSAEGIVGTSGLPEFWCKALSNHVLLAEMIEAHDRPILAHLQDIVFSWIDTKAQTSFKVDFHFSPNEFFTNTVLSKVYHLENSEDDVDESVLTKTEGTTIDWLPGKNVTEKRITRKQRNKRTQETRTITQMVEDNSFFNFFQSHQIPSEAQWSTMDDKELAELEMIVEAEFEVGCILRDRIIPRALGWYLGIEKDDDAESDASGGGSDFASSEEGDSDDDDDSTK